MDIMTKQQILIYIINKIVEKDYNKYRLINK